MIFSGIFLLNLFYWTTNQQIIQRTFGASSLAEGQKGVLLTGALKLLGPLYLLMGDVVGAVKSFDWFEQTFPDDIGEPVHFLCWTLALDRSGDTAQAVQRLRQTMLSNLYLIPHLLGREQAERIGELDAVDHLAE